MFLATLWGILVALGMVLGTLLALSLPIKRKTTATIMAFGTGVLLGAVSFDLLPRAYHAGGIDNTILGFFSGAMVFSLADYLIDKRGGRHRKRSWREEQKNPGNTGTAIMIGSTLDTLPESAAIGGSLAVGEGVSILLLAAIFLSNFPEGLSATIGLKRQGFSPLYISVLNLIIIMLSALSALGGYLLLASASGNTTAIILSFAAGAILTMVADTMLPEAFEEGGNIVGLGTAVGFFTAFILSLYS